MSIEYRDYGEDLKPELREAEGNKLPNIVGYAVKWNTLSNLLGGFKERFSPGAFAESLSEDRDVVAFSAHNKSQPLGRLSKGTLRLEEDETGLRYEISPPDVGYARDLVSLVERGDIKGASFGFKPRKTRFANEDGYLIREVHNATLKEVSPTAIPAYVDTEAQLRSMHNVVRERMDIDVERAVSLLAKTFSRDELSEDETNELRSISEAFANAVPKPEPKEPVARKLRERQLMLWNI